MEKVRSPKFKITYDGRDISQDISLNLLSFTYSDSDENITDEIDITVEDVEHKWKNSWYPTKGSKLTVAIGWDNENTLVPCGTFTIDEVTGSGSMSGDTISIKAVAAGIGSSIRTKRSKAFENQTLRQIAQYVAQQNGFTVQGTIANIKFTRITQHRQTDLNFLSRLASEYGHIFSVRDKTLVFTSVYEIEGGRPVVTVDRGELATWRITDKTLDTYESAKVSYLNPADGQTKNSNILTLSNKDNVTYKQIQSKDSLQIRTKAETPAQAEAKATAALHRKNSAKREGTVTMEGNPLLVAGNNLYLTGLGEFSGKYYIKKSTHRITKGGYTSDVEIKQISAATANDKTGSGNGRPKTNAYKVENRTNKDEVTYTQITPAK